MKKIFSIFLIAFATLTANVFSAGAGNINFRFNIKDAADNPVSGVTVTVAANFYNAGGNNLGEKNFVTVGPSGDDGLAIGIATFNNIANNYGDNWGVGSGWIIFGPSFSAYQSVWRLSAIGPSGYSFAKCEFSSSSTRATKSGPAGNDERFSLTGDWLNNGATIVYNVTVNTPAPTISFDTSELSNASDFTSMTVEKGTVINPSSIPTPVNINANKEFQYWSTDGITQFDFSQPINTNIKLIPVFTVEISFDTSTISNASSFATYYVPKGSYIIAPSATPVNASHSDWVLLFWSANGSSAFDFSQPVNSDMRLTPKWSNPNKQGIIHFQVYLWDHDGYREPQKMNPGSGYVNIYTGVNGSQVPSNYASYELTGKGWTTIPVSGLRFKLRTYPHQSGAPTNPGPVGAPVTPGWENDIDISTVTTDEDGRATMIIPSEDMQYLTANYCIDCDPDPNCVGTIIRDADYGRELCVFDWDWMTLGAGQGAGLVGVRYIREGPRHQDTGIQIGSWNDNDALLLTQDNIDNGFECTFVCYVLSAPCAQFDVNGGTMPTSTDPALYPIQIFKPENSAGVHVDPWIVKDPGAPIPNNPAAETFAGWFEVRYDMSGHGFESTVPFDFSQVIQKSVNLIAKYKGIVPMYTVRWAPDGWTGAPDSDLYEIGTTYELGQTPTFNQELPTRDGADITGWDIYVKMKDGSGDKTFGSLGKYKYIKTVTQAQPDDYVFDPDDLNCMRYVVYQGETFWCSPLAVGAPDGNGTDQIYVARFRTMLTVTKSGLKLGDSALITVTNGVDTRKIVLTGNSSGTDVSKTLYVDAGTWTVTEDMAWSWAYENSTSSKQVTITAGEHATISFTNSVKTTVPQHGEHLVNNVFNE